MRRLLSLIVLLFIPGGPALAGAGPSGPEFRVNSYTVDQQLFPSVGSGQGSEFVLSWSSHGQDGSNYGVFLRRFDRGGIPLSGEIQVNAYTTGAQNVPAVAGSGSGEFVVVWESQNQDGSSDGVFGQLFDDAGAPVGGEFQVNTSTTNGQRAPAVAMSATGGFVVAWSGYQGSSASEVFAQIFDANGDPEGAEFQVNTFTTGYQAEAAVAMDGAGGFVVVWESGGQDGSDTGVFGRMFDSAGSPSGPEFQVNAFTTGLQAQPAIGIGPSGDFVVAWVSQDQDGSYAGVFGRLFDSAGAPLASEFRINTFTMGEQTSPAIAVQASGEFVVAWDSFYQDGSDAGVFGQSFDSAGAPVALEFQINTYTPGSQFKPSAAMNAAGEFLVAWMGAPHQDGSGFGVFARSGNLIGPALTDPLPGDVVDCSDPALSRPTFMWDMGDYDQFKVYLGSSPGFEKGTRVTSGRKKITGGSWSPSKKKWKNACNKAITQAANPSVPEMFIAVLGKDRDLPKNDPLRLLFSFVVRTEVKP